MLQDPSIPARCFDPFGFHQWAFAAGVVDSRAAMLVYDREISLETLAYFVALDFDGDRVVSIHDFLFARYAMAGIDLSLLNLAPRSQ
jgi:hypothetical protein